MSKFSAIVCDHCDVRDILEGPSIPINGISERIITIELDKHTPDLCVKCFGELKDAVLRLTTQQPRQG